MAFKQRKNASSTKAASGKTQSRTAPKSQAELRGEDLREKALKGFHPTVVDWLKDNLRLDLRSNSVPVADIYKLSRGEFAGPFSMVVTPKVYDASKKEAVDGTPLQVYDSLRVAVPMSYGKPVAVDDDHKVYVQTVPCRPLVELAAPGEDLGGEVSPIKDERETKFSESQLMALEGIGIGRDRLYGGFNHLSRQEKLDILDGEIFPVSGVVKTDFGIVNVNGQGRLITDGDTARAVFEPTYLEKRTKDLVVDLESARIVGTMEVDIYERTPDGRRKKDVNGDFILNRAGENIRDFGASLEPVDVRLHKRVYDSKEKVWKDSHETNKAYVKVVNNSFYIMPLRENEAKELELPVVRFMRDKEGELTDKLLVLGQKKPLKVASKEDMENIRKGYGGVVCDVEYKGKDGKMVKYDAFVHIGESGYGEKFSPASTEAILRRKEKSQERKVAPARRKVRFGQGL